MQSHVLHIVSPDAAPAAALTPPETKNPERSRGPGSGWAQCAYAILVSGPASSKQSRCVCMFMCKRARSVRASFFVVNKNFVDVVFGHMKNARLR
jgi:hypothetical protein